MANSKITQESQINGMQNDENTVADWRGHDSPDAEQNDAR